MAETLHFFAAIDTSTTGGRALAVVLAVLGVIAFLVAWAFKDELADLFELGFILLCIVGVVAAVLGALGYGVWWIFNGG